MERYIGRHYFKVVSTGLLVLCTMQTAHSQVLISSSFFGGAPNAVATGVAVGSNGVYVSGNVGNTQQSLAAKFSLSLGVSPLWSTLWPTSASASGEGFGGVTVTGNGAYFAGYSYSQTTDTIGGKEIKSVLVNFPTGGPTGPGVGGAAWVAKPSFFPAYQGGEALLAATSNVEGGQNYIYSAGYGQSNGDNNTAMLIKHNEAGTQQWQQAIGDPSAGRGSDGAGVVALNNNIYVAGAQSSLSSASTTAVVWKYDTAGNAIWSQSFGGLNGAAGNAITALNGDIYETGVLYNGPNGGEDLFVRKYDESGNALWTTTWGGAGDDVGNGITILGNELYVAGTTSSFGAVTDGVLLNLSAASGLVDNTTLYGGSQDDGFTGIAGSGNDLYISGYADGSGSPSGQDNAMLLEYTAPASGTPEPGAIALTLSALCAGIGCCFRRRSRRRQSLIGSNYEEKKE